MCRSSRCASGADVGLRIQRDLQTHHCHNRLRYSSTRALWDRVRLVWSQIRTCHRPGCGIGTSLAKGRSRGERDQCGHLRRNPGNTRLDHRQKGGTSGHYKSCLKHLEKGGNHWHHKPCQFDKVLTLPPLSHPQTSPESAEELFPTPSAILPRANIFPAPH